MKSKLCLSGLYRLTTLRCWYIVAFHLSSLFSDSTNMLEGVAHCMSRETYFVTTETLSIILTKFKTHAVLKQFIYVLEG